MPRKSVPAPFALGTLLTLATGCPITVTPPATTPCPNDPPLAACTGSCCEQEAAYLSCARRNAPAICTASGKTDLGSQLCQKELGALLECGVTLSCTDFAAREFRVAQQPAASGAPGLVSAKLAGLDDVLGVNLSCAVLDDKGAPRAEPCTVSSGQAAATLPAGTYSMRIEAQYRACAPRTLRTETFKLVEPLVGDWAYPGQADRFLTLREGGSFSNRALYVYDDSLLNAPLQGCTVDLLGQGSWLIKDQGGLQLRFSEIVETRSGCADPSSNGRVDDGKVQNRFHDNLTYSVSQAAGKQTLRLLHRSGEGHFGDAVTLERK